MATPPRYTPSGMSKVRCILAALLCCLAASGETTVSDARYAHLARGVNLTRWFQYGSHIPITATDRDLLKNAGFTSVRIPVAPQYLLGHWSSQARIERNLANIDKAIDLFLDAGMAVTLDFHADTQYLDYYLASPEAPEELIALWHQLATRYADRDPELLSFEIMNEPDNRFTAAAWDTEQQNVLAAIREAAPRHTVILDSVNWSGLDALLERTPYRDPNVIYALHYYSPSTFTHQGADWTGKDGIAELRNIPWPSFVPELGPLIDAASPAAQALLRKYRDEDWDAQRIDWDMQLAATWAKQWNVRVIVNEFGDFKPFAPPESRARWLHDVRVALDRQKLDWAVWDYAAGFDLTVSKDGKRGIDPLIASALGLAPGYSIEDPLRSQVATFSGPRTVQIGTAPAGDGAPEGILAAGPDLIVAPMAWPDLTQQQVRAYRNDDMGIFRPVPFSGEPPSIRAVSSIVPGHFDSSGRTGFFLPDAGPRDGSGAQSRLILPVGRDALRDATSNLPQQIEVSTGAAAGDVDGDGFDDIALFRPQGLKMLRNDGNGHFEIDPEAFPVWATDPQQENNRFTCGVFVKRGSAKVEDLLVFGKAGSPARVFRNDGDGNFRNSTLLPPAAANTGPANGGCAVVTDLNGDGFPDVIVGLKQPAENQPDVLQVLVSNGDGTFRDETMERASPLPVSKAGLRRIAFAGGLLVMTRVGEPPVLERQQNGQFDVVKWNSEGNPWIVAPSDINGDGLTDLVFAPSGGSPLTARFGQQKP